MSATEQALCERWNREHQVGTPVRVWPGPRAADAPSEDSTTRSEAWVLGGHTAVVMVRGRAGAVALSHVAALR